jgi:4-hydroxy-tetrahydrodipicolinate reductase
MQATLPLGIVGPRGRMGTALVQLASAEADLAVVPVVRPGRGEGRLLVSLGRSEVAALIDFSHHDTVAEHADWVARHGVAWVLGTTGLSPVDQAAVNAASERTLVFQAANFSLGVALLTELAERAAKVLGVQADVEIAEVHHRHKKDAPSGTALALGRAIAAARGQDFEAVRRDSRSGLVGERAAGEIGFHALRLGDVVGEHEISFGWPYERLRLAHDARDRKVFAQGALQAARFCARLQTEGRRGLVGMRDLLAG